MMRFKIDAIQADKIIALAMLIALGILLAFRPASLYLSSLSDTRDIPQDPAQVAGIDVSHYQGIIDWNSVIPNDRVNFVYVKASDGITFVDPHHAKNVAALKQLNIPHGSYHFFEPNDDGIAQAESFLKSIGNSPNLPPVLDIEISHKVAKDDIVARAKAWLSHVAEKTGCQPLIYTYGDFYNEFLDQGFSDYKFWLADYAATPTLPNNVSNWTFWQHSQTGSVAGIKGKVDLDVFDGSIDSLESIVCNAIQ